MKIYELFLKPVDRPIEGVIKADDVRHEQAELDEYVVTRDVAKGLGVFTERYLRETTANGVWISGFFGSGKSHLLKMLSLVLDERPLPSGRRPADIILPKISDEIVQADLRTSIAIPARSVLFNIDQKFDGVGGDHSAPILEVFIKVLNELQGYYGKQGYVAKFESDLDSRGDFLPFKATYQAVNHSTWEVDREALATVKRAAFGRAYAEHFHVPESEAFDVMRQVRQEYRVSIESFAHSAKAYIAKQVPGFRLNFFVDEAGQFIGQDSKLMLNLQTLAETLATVCDGKAWIFVTSQADLEGVLGTFRGTKAHDLSKITARFKTQITLASGDVREVIQERLLAKTEAEPEILTNIFDREKENLKTLFRFGDNSLGFNGWRGSDEFCKLYPFHPYQFDLFQRAIQELSKHNAFTGKYLSVGERSMLAVFQEVAKAIRSENVGRLATFDLMYDGTSASIRGDMQTTLRMAENQLGEGIEVRILKALFLLKWVRDFKATPRNVAILLIETADVDIRAHETTVAKALARLESESYLQRNGDVYEFLTDTEKDIEVEIKETEIDDSQVVDTLADVLFGDVLRDAKIRYQGNGQDYPYARKIDDQLVSKRDADVKVNLITMDHEQHAQPGMLAMQNMGKAELLAILPADNRLAEQTRLWLQTKKYVDQNSSGVDETRKAIVTQRGQQNSARRSNMETIASELLGEAHLYINGARVEGLGDGDARNRFAKAFQQLISVSYPNLRMLKGTYDDSSLSRTLLGKDDLLAGGVIPPSEPEQEILQYVTMNQNNGERTSLEEIIKNFEHRPYGWGPLAVLCLVARLFRMGKVELRGPEVLDARGVLASMQSNRKWGSVRVRLQEQFDALQVNALKAFHVGFFDRPNPGVDARSVGEATAERFAAEAGELSTLLDQVNRYPFLEPLRPVAERAANLAHKDYTYLLTHLTEFQHELLAAKEDVLAPIKAFMRGPQRPIYDEAIAFLKEEEANFVELPPAEVAPLRDLASSPRPYLGGIVPAGKLAVTKLRTLLAELLNIEREKASQILAAQEGRLETVPGFSSLPESDRERVMAATAALRRELLSARFASGMRDRVQRYVEQDYPAQVALAARLVAARLSLASAPASNSTSGQTPTPAASSSTVVTARPDKPPVEYISSRSLQPNCPLALISSMAELDQWLTALRTAAEAELNKGNVITL
jgi:hypothetical protein